MKIREPVPWQLGVLLYLVRIALMIFDEGHAIWDMGLAITWLLLGMVRSGLENVCRWLSVYVKGMVGF